MTNLDKKYMQIALNLAYRGLGNTRPNPSVGCVIVNHDKIIGRGWTQKNGRPHAETHALSNLIESPQGATAYVTLEPCAHYGRTPPCVDVLIKAGIARIIIATNDPNPLVSGHSIAKLKATNIEVIEGIDQEQADEINAGFFLNILENRPLVTLKLALTNDGKMITPQGTNPKITNDISHRYAHILRKEYDAIMVGIGTLIADNPLLTCRLNGLSQHSPMRVIIDSQLRTPPDCNIMQDTIPTLIFSKINEDKYPPHIEIIQQDKIDLKVILQYLAQRNITRLLVEGGEKLATSLLQQNLIDRVITIESPDIKGAENATNMPELIQNTQHNLTRQIQRKLGDDKLTINL